MNGDRADRPVRRRAVLPATALGAVAVALVLGLAVAPPDAVQGEAQRLMYLHVPAAWCAYLCFAVVLLVSVVHLVRRTSRYDALAQAAAEVGVALTALTIVTGSLWGYPTWGTWWVWDARLTSTAALLCVYVAYLALRQLLSGRGAGTVVAWTGVAGFAVVPLVHFSVLWWRTLHQPPTLLGPSTSPPIDPLMALALAAAVLAFTLLTVWTVRRRVAALAARGGSATQRPRTAQPEPVVP